MVFASFHALYSEISISARYHRRGYDPLGRRKECTKLYFRVAKGGTTRVNQASVNAGVKFDCEIGLNLELVARVGIGRTSAYELAFRQ